MLARRYIILEVRSFCREKLSQQAIGELRSSAVQALDVSSTWLMASECYNTQPMDYAR